MEGLVLAAMYIEPGPVASGRSGTVDFRGGELLVMSVGEAGSIWI